MNGATWKASERRVARALGGRRVPVTGRGRSDVADIDHPTFAIEHKAGRVMSSRLLTAVSQAVAATEVSGKVPLVTIDQSVGPSRPNQRFVLLRLEDWLAIAPARE